MKQIGIQDQTYKNLWLAKDPTNNVLETVSNILEDIKENGLTAVVKYVQKFEDPSKDEESLAVNQERLTELASHVDSEFIESLEFAKRNIKKVAEAQLIHEKEISVVAGVTILEKVIPLDSVAIYVPAGRFPLVSSMLMGVITAQVANVSNIYVVTPKVCPLISAAASILNISQVFEIGGAQAIGAFAYGATGTQVSIPRVDKICGPGNAYVATAKELVSQDGTGIDMVAGPTEYLALVTEDYFKKNPKALTYICLDMLAQAEHGPDSKVALITNSKNVAEDTTRIIQKLLPQYPNSQKAIEDFGFIKICENVNIAIDIANELAPEHIWVEDTRVADQIKNAGTILIGTYSSAGNSDYVDGPNHVLPTNLNAQMRGGLSVLDFIKVVSQHHITDEGLKNLGRHGYNIGAKEGLIAHADSIRIRLEDLDEQQKK
jgi:histidinol dehydrogenase